MALYDPAAPIAEFHVIEYDGNPFRLPKNENPGYVAIGALNTTPFDKKALGAKSIQSLLILPYKLLFYGVVMGTICAEKLLFSKRAGWIIQAGECVTQLGDPILTTPDCIPPEIPGGMPDPVHVMVYSMLVTIATAAGIRVSKTNFEDAIGDILAAAGCLNFKSRPTFRALTLRLKDCWPLEKPLDTSPVDSFVVEHLPWTPLPITSLVEVLD